MGELSIKIRIADKDYPMRVSAEDQDKIRLAGKQLNDKIKLFKDQFGVDDKQDLLAMVAFDGAVEQVNASDLEIQHRSDAELLSRISDLDNLVTSALSD
jgi:cell division protein ZapA